MTNEHLTKDEWVELLRDAGLGEEMMHRWHTLFEERAPAAHQGFLEWLGLSEDEIAAIRARFRQ